MPASSCEKDAALVSYLFARADGHDIVVPSWQQHLQPLHAVYRRTLQPLFEEAIAQGERRPAGVFHKVRTCTVDEAEMRALDPDGWSGFNVNTPDDYRRALERCAGLGRTASRPGRWVTRGARPPSVPPSASPSPPVHPR